MQLLRSEEYCTVAHRKKYQERLGRVLHRIADDERRAIRIADFKENWPTQTGFSKQIGDLEFRHTSPQLQSSGTFSLNISSVASERTAAMQEPAALEMEQPPAHAEPALVHASGTAALPAFELAEGDTSRAECSTPAGPHAIRPALPISLPMSQAFWPAGQPMVSGSVLAAKLPTFQLNAGAPPDTPSFCESPAEMSEPVVPEHRPSPASCVPKLAAAHSGILPAFAVGTAQPALQPPALCEVHREVAAAAAAGQAPTHAPCNPTPRLENTHAAALPQFALTRTQAPLADTRTAAAMEPAAMCGICIPLPAAEPAVCYVDHRSEPQWKWRAADVRYPAVPAAQVAKPEPRWETAFAPTPGADALEMPLYAGMWATLLHGPMPVQLPVGLDRVLAGITVPLAVAAAAGAGQPQTPAVTPVAAFTSASPRHHAVQLPHTVRDIAAAEFHPAAPAEFPAAAAESLPRVEFAAVPQISPFALHYPEFRMQEQAAGTKIAAAGPRQEPAAAASGNAAVSPLPLELLSRVQVASPKPSLSASTASAVPQAGMVAIEFFCRRANATPTLSLTWMMPAPRLCQPRLQISPALEIVEEAPAPPPRNQNAIAEVFQLPGARKPGAWLREFARPLAACFLVAAFLWAVAATMHVASRTAAVNRDVATLIQTEEGSSASDSSVAPQSTAAPAAAPGEQGGFMSRMRGAIASRAASQITETFHEGMGAWADGKKGAPSGWARSAEGFVRPAAFAMFRPSAAYRDYRVEFFGQIEQKGLSWAVRATDPKNYYAMKFKVVEPGLRPVVAIEHYPVVDGRKGRRTQVPLPEVMFHNNTPYRVEVAVRGNRITTSVEGQEVDTWFDDTLSKGGVGFFADAGEKSRVYWVKVAKNEDFLGRICAYIAGGADHPATAGLWPHNGAPSSTPFGPGSGWPAEPTPVAVATLFAFKGSQDRRRTAPWSL